MKPSPFHIFHILWVLKIIFDDRWVGKSICVLKIAFSAIPSQRTWYIGIPSEISLNTYKIVGRVVRICCVRGFIFKKKKKSMEICIQTSLLHLACVSTLSAHGIVIKNALAGEKKIINWVCFYYSDLISASEGNKQ